MKQGDGLPTAKGKSYQETSISETEHLLSNHTSNSKGKWQCKGRLYISRE